MLLGEVANADHGRGRQSRRIGHAARTGLRPRRIGQGSAESFHSPAEEWVLHPERCSVGSVYASGSGSTTFLSGSVVRRRVMARLSELLVSVRDAAARFEADRWSGYDCVRLAEELARAAKACAAACRAPRRGRWSVAGMTGVGGAHCGASPTTHAPGDGEAPAGARHPLHITPAARHRPSSSTTRRRGTRLRRPRQLLAQPGTVVTRPAIRLEPGGRRPHLDQQLRQTRHDPPPRRLTWKEGHRARPRGVPEPTEHSSGCKGSCLSRACRPSQPILDQSLPGRRWVLAPRRRSFMLDDHARGRRPHLPRSNMKFGQKALLSGALVGAAIAGGAVGASVLGTAQAQTSSSSSDGGNLRPVDRGRRQPRSAHRERDHRDPAHR